MPVTNITKDLENRTLTITAEFKAPKQRLWDLYADGRQLEQVWGPPSHPATFTAHELTPGARSTYFMTSPEGEKYYGFWEIKTVSPIDGFTFDDGFAADDTYAAAPGMPVSGNGVVFTESEGVTTSVWTSTYATAEEMQKVLDMGMEEGARQSINQIDDFLIANP